MEQRLPKLWPVLAIAAVIVVLGTAGLPAIRGPMVGSAHPSTNPGGLAGTLSDGAGQLARAVRSLSLGQGPAAGQSWACPASPAGVASCLVPEVAPPAPSTLRWANLTPLLTNQPTGRLTSMAWDTADGYAVLFGGVALTGFLSDTWTYANGTWTNVTNRLTGPSPPGLVGASMAYDPSTHAVILFGGQNRTYVTQAQTWSYHALSWTNLTGTVGLAPAPRLLAGMTTDSTDQAVLMVGGRGATSFHDTWTFHNGAWTNLTSLAPIAAVLSTPTLSDDPADGGVLLFSAAAWSPTYLVPGTWVFSGGLSGGSWRNESSLLGTDEPPMVVLGPMAFDPAVGAIVFTGHVEDNSTASRHDAGVTWTYAAGAWTNQSLSMGSPAMSCVVAGAALDPNDDSFLVFSGENVGIPGGFLPAYTFALTGPPTVHPSASRSVIDAGMSIGFTGVVANGTSPNSVSWAFGDGGTSTLPNPSHVYATAGVYTATLTATSFLGLRDSRSVTLDVNPDLALSTASIPSRATSGENTTFAAIVSGGTGPLSYAWSFGDGSLSVSPVATHDFVRPGTYSVNLTVTDALGAKVNGTVRVSVATPPSTASGSVDVSSGAGLGLLIVIVLLGLVAAVLGVLWARARRPPRPMGPMAFSPGAPPSPPPPPPPP